MGFRRTPYGELLAFGVKLNPETCPTICQQRASHIFCISGIGSPNLVHRELIGLGDIDSAGRGTACRRSSIHLPRKILHLVDARRRSDAIDDTVDLVA